MFQDDKTSYCNKIKRVTANKRNRLSCFSHPLFTPALLPSPCPQKKHSSQNLNYLIDRTHEHIFIMIDGIEFRSLEVPRETNHNNKSGSLIPTPHTSTPAPLFTWHAGTVITPPVASHLYSIRGYGGCVYTCFILYAVGICTKSEFYIHGLTWIEFK